MGYMRELEGLCEHMDGMGTKVRAFGRIRWSDAVDFRNNWMGKRY